MCKLFFIFFLFLFSDSIYNIPVPAAGNATIDLNNYRGKKILVVNTASNSPYVSQYAGLQQLYDTYRDSLVVIVVPSNSFGNEPADDSTLDDFAARMYLVTFPIAAKADVTGDNALPLYQWLTSMEANGDMNSQVNGDFQKYLIDANGKLEGVFAADVEPLSEELVSAIRGE